MERSDGMRLVVQLPRCYAPAGMLRDFDGGLRLPVCPLTSSGRKSLAALHRICRRLLRKGAPAGVATAPSGSSASSADWAAETSVNPVRPGGEAALLKTQRESDCCLFEADGTTLRDGTGRGVLPGETIVPLVCVEHVWVRRPQARLPRRPRFLGDPGTWPGQDCGDDRDDRGATPALSAGISLKVLQVIVVTERFSVPRFGFVASSASCACACACSGSRACASSGACAGSRELAGAPWSIGTGAPGAPEAGAAGAGAAGAGAAGNVAAWAAGGNRLPKRPAPLAGGSWVPSENDIKSALSRLRKVDDASDKKLGGRAAP